MFFSMSKVVHTSLPEKNLGAENTMARELDITDNELQQEFLIC